MLPKDAEVTVFNDHIADQAKLIARLRDFEIVCVCANAHRSIAPAIERCQAETDRHAGMRNQSIDTQGRNDAASWCVHRKLAIRRRAHMGLDPVADAHIHSESQASRGQMADHGRHGLKGKVLA